MKPYIISHMMESVDGRIDCAMTELIEEPTVYYNALETLKCDSQLMGRVTMQLHYAENQLFSSVSKTAINKEAWHIGNADTRGYTIAIDTHGCLTYTDNVIDGLSLLVVTSEDATQDYLDLLTSRGISWIATGKGHINLPRAMELCAEKFGVKRIALVGGGHINGSFLNEGLLDEISVMISPGIDGRAGMTAVFDGITSHSKKPTLLTLKSLSQVGNGTIWARYTIK